MKNENESLRTDFNLMRNQTKILEEKIIQIEQSEQKRTKKPRSKITGRFRQESTRN